jgi:hypothetical protein
VVAVQLVVLVACAGLSAILETMLVPYRIGTVIVPVAIVGAVLSNSVLPVLAWRTRRSVPAAALPFGVWVITVLFLSQSRPEGDVLLPGGKSGITYVSYGLLVAGFVAGLATLVWLGNRAAVLRSTSGARRP